uniref:MHC class I-like antigen recognition-like domain-containing protein n=1 Tax=Suricata suricatta TaxID=37032 RepID=A0A673TW98_SURSU
MLLLQLVLLMVLVPGGDNFQEPIFRVILTSSFYNRWWTQNQGSAWLDKLQTHGWDSKTGAFFYLQPWSRGNVSKEAFVDLEKLFYSYSIKFLQMILSQLSCGDLPYSLPTHFQSFLQHLFPLQLFTSSCSQ